MDGWPVDFPETLLRLAKLWQFKPPNSKQRLQPKRACGLGWGKKETFALLESHVDVTDDTTQLVAELLARFPIARQVGLENLKPSPSGKENHIISSPPFPP